MKTAGIDGINAGVASIRDVPELRSCTIDLDAEVVGRIKQLFGLDFSRVRTFMVVRKNFNVEQVEAMEREYKRFLCLSIAFPTKGFPISEAVDEMWHCHILFTKEYHAASAIVGRDYIHHLPTLNEADRAALEPHYFRDTLGCYRQLFGEPPEVWWPKDSASICWSCSSSPEARACSRRGRDGTHHQGVDTSLLVAMQAGADSDNRDRLSVTD